jgi:hypothetical protein
MKELDTVVLRRDLPHLGLVEGDLGAVVHVHDSGVLEVEFVTGEGATFAVATLDAEDVEPIDRIPHER